MSLATLVFSNLNWRWPVAGAAALLLVFMAWSYRAGPAGGMRWLCAGLKALGIAALLFCLLEPLWSGQRPKPGANLFAVVADNSEGLQIKDRGEAQTRGESLRKLLDPDHNDWPGLLAEHFEVRRFIFDARLQASREFTELDFGGRASAIGSALRGISERFSSRSNLAGVLLLTDGNATDIRDALPKLDGLPPVYPVIIGQPGAVSDLSLAQVTVSQTAFEDAPVSLQADVSAVGLNGENVSVQLLDATGHKLEEQSLRARKDDDTLAFHFQWRPEKAGLSFYRVRASLESELQPSTNAAPSKEATLVNNTRVVSVDRGRGPYRILYVAGRPDWEFKFMNRAAQEDEQLQLVALIRIALREPKFDFRGHAGETSNPLFRGSENQTKENVVDYDKPVLQRLNTRDEIELRSGFPRTPEDLYGYSAVIVAKLEASFFAADQLALLQKYVSERGGGFLMLGGADSLQQGQYQRTPVGDMLPVYLDRAAQLKPPDNVKLTLAREGWLQSWARVRDNESDERARLESMRAFTVMNPQNEIKPGAGVVMTATDEAGKDYPALVTQRFGRGRTAVFTIGDFFHWGMQNLEAHKDMDKSWRQMLRWLVADVPAFVELAVEQPEDVTDGAVQLQVRARDPRFQPVDDAAVTIEIQPVLSEAAGATTNAVLVRAEPSLKEAGLYEASYVPRNTGGYRARAFVTNSVGIEVGHAEAGWSTDLAAEEFRSLQPNVALLEAIAKRTGGEVIPAAKLAEFARSLEKREAPVMEAWTMPVWHTPLVFVFALACFASEWGLRRWKGMP